MELTLYNPNPILTLPLTPNTKQVELTLYNEHATAFTEGSILRLLDGYRWSHSTYSLAPTLSLSLTVALSLTLALALALTLAPTPTLT